MTIQVQLPKDESERINLTINDNGVILEVIGSSQTLEAIAQAIKRQEPIEFRLPTGVEINWRYNT